MELSEIISVIKINGRRNAIGVVSKCGPIISVGYPLYKGYKEVECGTTGCSVSDVTAIRPATEEEIREWRNAPGVAKAARKAANTVDKVKAIKWVAADIRCGHEIINTL